MWLIAIDMKWLTWHSNVIFFHWYRFMFKIYYILVRLITVARTINFLVSFYGRNTWIVCSTNATWIEQQRQIELRLWPTRIDKIHEVPFYRLGNLFEKLKVNSTSNAFRLQKFTIDYTMWPMSVNVLFFISIATKLSQFS